MQMKLRHEYNLKKEDNKKHLHRLNASLNFKPKLVQLL